MLRMLRTDITTSGISIFWCPHWPNLPTSGPPSPESPLSPIMYILCQCNAYLSSLSQYIEALLWGSELLEIRHSVIGWLIVEQFIQFYCKHLKKILFHSIRTLIIRSQFFPGSGRIMATRFNGSLKDQISEEGRSLILLLVPFHPFQPNPPHYISSIGLHSTSSIGLQSSIYILHSTSFSLTIHSTLADFPVVFF